MEKPVTPKKESTPLITLIVTSIVAIFTGVATNYDKIFSKSETKPATEELKKEISLTFAEKLNKVINESPLTFSNIIGVIREEDEVTKNYHSSINFEEGMTSVVFPIDTAEKAHFQVDIYSGFDTNLANQKYTDIYKKISESVKTKAVKEESVNENISTEITTFEKGSTNISIYVTTTQTETETTFDVTLVVGQK